MGANIGACESKENMAGSIAEEHNRASEHKEMSGTVQLKRTNQNEIIEKAKSTIDAANNKIKALNERCSAVKRENEALEAELKGLKKNDSERDRLTKEYKQQLDVQRATMIKWKSKIQELSEEIVNIEQERKEQDDEYKNSLLSINDSFYKIQGDTVSKLKYGKMSRKFAVFTTKINHLFYYDESGIKYMVVRDVSIKNNAIQKPMNLPWILVIGHKRSALFAAESTAKRDKWYNFIKKSLGKNVEDREASLSIVNPLFSADHELEHSLSHKVTTNHDENHKNDAKQNGGFGQMQSPINIISTTHCGHTMVMKDEEFASNPLTFNYPQFVKNCTILNNGHTVQINIADSNKCTLSIHGKRYQLKQFHFHTPSEHTIDSRQFEMEMHLVHVNEENEIAVLGFIFTTRQKYQKPKLELTASRAHLILNNDPMVLSQKSKLRVMKESDDDESDDMETDDEWNEDDDDDFKKLGAAKKGNDFLDQFWDQLPSKKTSRDIALKKDISFDYLFETSSNNFIKNVKTNEVQIDMEIFEYKGSLTTPPFTEGVQWLVSKTTHFINNKQLNKLSACWNHENNARPVQEYFGRTVSLRNQSSLRVVT